MGTRLKDHLDAERPRSCAAISLLCPKVPTRGRHLAWTGLLRCGDRRGRPGCASVARCPDGDISRRHGARMAGPRSPAPAVSPGARAEASATSETGGRWDMAVRTAVEFVLVSLWPWPPRDVGLWKCPGCGRAAFCPLPGGGGGHAQGCRRGQCDRRPAGPPRGVTRGGHPTSRLVRGRSQERRPVCRWPPCVTDTRGPSSPPGGVRFLRS